MRKLLLLTMITIVFLTFGGYYPTLEYPPIKQSQVFAQESQQEGEVVAISFSKPLILPHPGYLSTPFSSYHPGIDIATGLGMPIHPIIDGVVDEIGHDIFGLGNYVSIIHEGGFKSKYGHMGTIYVKKGDKVSSENTIGEVGLSGHTSGPHTHLEITQNGVYIDPQKLLPILSDIPISEIKK